MAVHLRRDKDLAAAICWMESFRACSSCASGFGGAAPGAFTAFATAAVCTATSRVGGVFSSLPSANSSSVTRGSQRAASSCLGPSGWSALDTLVHAVKNCEQLKGRRHIERCLPHDRCNQLVGRLQNLAFLGLEAGDMFPQTVHGLRRPSPVGSAGLFSLEGFRSICRGSRLEFGRKGRDGWIRS